MKRRRFSYLRSGTRTICRLTLICLFIKRHKKIKMFSYSFISFHMRFFFIMYFIYQPNQTCIFFAVLYTQSYMQIWIMLKNINNTIYSSLVEKRKKQSSSHFFFCFILIETRIKCFSTHICFNKLEIKKKWKRHLVSMKFHSKRRLIYMETISKLFSN